jgi:hypothetical protein
MNIQLSDDTSITNSNPANGYSYVAGLKIAVPGTGLNLFGTYRSSVLDYKLNSSSEQTDSSQTTTSQENSSINVNIRTTMVLAGLGWTF